MLTQAVGRKVELLTPQRGAKTELVAMANQNAAEEVQRATSAQERTSKLMEALGRLYLQEFGAIPVPEELIDYIDYEAYGRDVRINENGHFAPGGYVRGGGAFTEVYHGVQDIPDEHKVFALPQLTIREQMAAYQEIIDGSSLEGYREITQKEHEER